MANVIQAKAGEGYFVRSRSTAGAYYLVHIGEDQHLTCTCPATVERCRHMRAAVEFWASDSRNHARPAMPAHISALVD